MNPNQPDMSSLGVNPLGGVGNLMELYAHESTIPNINSLVSLKMLKDADPAFGPLMHEETKWLKAGLSVLRNDPYLRLKMGGDGISAAMKMAGVLKARAEYKNLVDRVDETVTSINTSTFDPLIGGLPEALKPSATVARILPAAAGVPKHLSFRTTRASADGVIRMINMGPADRL